MYNENNIYNCALESVNNILQNGIDYYCDKNSIYYNKLKEIYDYVNKNIEPTKYNIIPEYKSKKNNLPDEVYTLLNNYINSILEIKVSVLNLEDDSDLYYNICNFEEKKDNSKEEVISTQTFDEENNSLKNDNVSSKDVYVPNNDNKEILNLF